MGRVACHFGGGKAMTQPLYTVRQVAYVVKDMEKALKYWTEYLNVGPFFMFEHCPLENQFHSLYW